MGESTTDEKAFVGYISQAEAQYTPLSNTPSQACANCRWFKPYGNWCHIVEDSPEPILPTGHSNRWEAVPQTAPLEAAPIPVVIVEPPLMFDDSAEMSLTVPKSLGERLQAFVSKLRKKEQSEPVFSVFKAANGRNAWVARFTGKFIDRENEILADAAHDAYVERVQAGKVAMPELWMWHAKGTRHGEAVAVWKSGGFVCAAGYFDENAVGQRAFDYYQKQGGKIKLSHMFHYPKSSKIGGVYYDYNTVEITTLPDGAEAFPYTSFEEIETMALNERARADILAALGPDVLARAESMDKHAEADSKNLESAGVAHKGYDQYDGSLLPAVSSKLLDFDTRLKATEDSLKQLAVLASLPETVKSLNESVQKLSEQVAQRLEADTKTLEKLNALEQKQAELTDLKPPASKSDNTLLEQRERSLIDEIVKQGESADQKTLIGSLMEGKPFISQTPAQP